MKLPRPVHRKFSFLRKKYYRAQHLWLWGNHTYRRERYWENRSRHLGDRIRKMFPRYCKEGIIP